MKEETCHIPVLLTEVVEALQADRGGHFLDCTLGGGGHSEALLQANASVQVTALDRDERALQRTKSRLKDYADRISFHHCSFSEAGHRFGQEFDGVLADLGISSDQLQEERGFSFHDPGALDMRMDERQSKTAATVVNTYADRDLKRVLQRGGCGKEAGVVTKAILRARPIESTHQLKEVVDSVMRGRSTKKSIQPSTVVFQAIRIEVNDELKEIETLMDNLPGLLKPGGRAAIISFHSLEDKLVTKTMRDWQGRDRPPANYPGAHVATSAGKLLTSKAIVPGEEESQTNRRARSARLRVFQFNEKGEGQ